MRRLHCPVPLLLAILAFPACMADQAVWFDDPAALAQNTGDETEGEDRGTDVSDDGMPYDGGGDSHTGSPDLVTDAGDASSLDPDEPLPEDGDQESGIIVVDLGPDRPGDTSSPDAQQEPVPFSFVVFGDNQFATSSCTSGVPERLAVPEVMLDLAPDFVLHVGDLVDHAYEEGAYERFVYCYEDLLSTTPFFPTMGNHDAGSGGITVYKAFLEWLLFENNPAVYLWDYAQDFSLSYEDDTTDWSTDRDNPSDMSLLPSGVTWKTYYAFRHSNAYFISFEQGTRWWTQTPKPWLEEHLSRAQADPAIDHIFVIMHHPMYSTLMAESDSGECIEPVRRAYEELFRLYDVTVVFSGHVHSYDRFHVPDDGGSTRTASPPDLYSHDGSAIHYIVNGGGGGPLTNGCDPFPLREELSYEYSQARGCFHHLLEVTVDGSEVEIRAHRVDGSATAYDDTVVDTFTIVSE